MAINYRGYSIEISKQKDFSGVDRFYYTITGRNLAYPVMTSVGETTRQAAESAARYYVDYIL